MAKQGEGVPHAAAVAKDRLAKGEVWRPAPPLPWPRVGGAIRHR